MPQEEQQQRGDIFGNWRMILLAIALMYFFMPSSRVSPPADVNVTLHKPVIGPGAQVDVFVHLSEEKRCDYTNMIWHEKDLVMGAWQGRSKSVKVATTHDMRNNGSYFAHIFVLPSGMKPIELSRHPYTGVYSRFNVVRHAYKHLGAEKRSLLEEGQTSTPTPVKPKEIGGHWVSNMTISIIDEYSTYRHGAIPPTVKPFLALTPNGDYLPIVHNNDFWITREDYIILNDTVTGDLDLHLVLEPMTSWKWQIFNQMEQSFEMQKNFGAEEGDTDQFKHMLLDNNPAVLVITFLVSMLHMVFEFLAFKNDIKFWKDAKSMEGLSVKSLFIQLVMQSVIFLYLLDHEETSLMILIPAGIGILIEGWKITKAVIVNITWVNGLPRLSLEDRETYKSKTKDIDDKAMGYLAYAIIPLLIGYSIYSLYYETHKSWYSWILSSITGAIYTFGFIMMTPQLFINYKLKSVAHLPWRVFVYKAINTFIDDIFAWVIRMPTMHRLATLRDDVIFVIYLYQRWIYRVDMSRVNEYGQVMKEEKDKDKQE